MNPKNYIHIETKRDFGKTHTQNPIKRYCSHLTRMSCRKIIKLKKQKILLPNLLLEGTSIFHKRPINIRKKDDFYLIQKKGFLKNNIAYIKSICCIP